MATIKSLFVTRIYRDEHRSAAGRRLTGSLERSVRALMAGDKAGQAWARDHDYQGYTSYASLNNLTVRDPAFADLEAALDPHVAAFGKILDLDLGGRAPKLDSIRANVLDPGCYHTAHIHSHSVILRYNGPHEQSLR